jgi:predicted RNA-binding Zn-ribbon protein involved in translation (DUF1610 family)
MKIEIPTDNDEYVLLQCPLCGNYFKIIPHNDDILELHCPNCGLVSDNYFTEDVIELAKAMAQNYAIKLIHKEMKQLERMNKRGNFTFKVGKKPKEEYESPIRATVEAMAIHQYQCCGRSIKIRPLLLMTGSYCPFCGVREF